MAIGRITGQMLFQNLERQGVDLQFDSNLVYMDVTNRRVGINNISPQYSFDSSGNVKIANIVVIGNTITSNTGKINFGETSNIVIAGGSQNSVLYTDGDGNLNWGQISDLDSVWESIDITSANITTLQTSNFSTGNAVVSGGYISSLTNAYITTSHITDLSTGNAVISGGYISALSNATITTGNTESWYATELNVTQSNIDTGVTVNFSTGNAVISGGYISALSNATITTGNTESWYATELNSTAANITSGNAQTWYTTELNSTQANITSGNAQVWYASELNSTNGNIETINGTSLTVYEINATVANISGLALDNVTIYNANITNGNITTITAETTTTFALNSTSGNITTGNIDTLNTTVANITTGNAQIWYATELNSTTGNITTITAETTTTFALNSTSGNITTGNIDTLNTSLANITSGNAQVWYATELNSTVANITTGNAQIWYATELNSTVANITTGNAQVWYATELNSTVANVTSGNSLVWYSTYLNSTIGNINAVASEFTETVNLNSTQGNIPTLVADNFSSGNIRVTGGSISGIAISDISSLAVSGNVTASWFLGNVAGRIGNYSQVVNTPILYAGGNSAITASTVTLQDIKIVGNALSSTTGNLVLAADKTDANHVVRFDSISALGLPAGTYLQRPGEPDQGYLRYNTDIGTIEWWTGLSWGTAVNTITSEILYPDGITNVLTLGQTASTVGVLVNINGTIQQAGTAYTVYLNQITFAETPLVTDIIEIRYLAAGVASADYYGGPVGGAVHILDTTNSTSFTTGALIVDGGVGIANDVHVAGTIYGTVVGTIEVAGGINGTVIGNTNPETGGFTTLITTGNVSIGGETTVIGNILPSVDSLYTLGNVDYRFKDIWLSGTSIYLGDATISTDFSGAVVLPAGSSVGGTPVDATLAQHDLDISELNSNAISQAQSINSINSSVSTINNNIVSLRANITAANLAISTIQSNLGAFQSYANANIGTLHLGNISTNANLGAFQVWSNANVASQSGSINIINANIGTLHLGNISTNANLGAYQTYANAAIVTTQANLGAYQTYANANVVSIQANLGAYQAYANTKIGTNTNSNLVVVATTESDSVTTGALVVKGGAGIAGNLYVGGNLIVSNVSYEFREIVSTTETVLGNIFASSSTISTSTTTGALVVVGGAGIGGNLNVGGNIAISGNILPSGANVFYNLGSTTQWWNTFYGVSTQAKYADLAENYAADAEYEPGTVVIFGGTAEITTTTQDHDPRIAGVISTNPAYLMNAAAVGLPVALQGRAPCRVLGPVSRGDLLTSCNIAGVAQKLDKTRFEHGCIIGKSLADINSAEIALIEIVVGLH